METKDLPENQPAANPDAMMVRIACQGAETMPIGNLIHFQGNLKTLSKDKYEKLKYDILSLGFSEPISVWPCEADGKTYILNGHQRVNTLTKMASEGYIIPEIPVNLVEATDYKEAKMKVLSLTSQFGQMDEEGLYEFVCDAGITSVELLAGFSFPEISLPGFVKNYMSDAEVKDKAEDKEKKATVEYVTCPNCAHHFTV